MRRAFTLVELLVVVAVIAVLVALLLPAIQRVREAANRAKCQNNLKQAALALHAYHDQNSRLPEAMSGANTPDYGTWLVLTLPYVEQGEVARLYRNYGRSEGTVHPRYYFSPNKENVTTRRFAVMTCPSDTPRTIRSAEWSSTMSNVTRHNYAVNFGNTTYLQNDLPDAAFGKAPFTAWANRGRGVPLKDVTDGTSGTLLLGEVIQPAGRDLRAMIWFGTTAGFSAYAPPNSGSPDVVSAGNCNPDAPNPPCVDETSANAGRLFARSRHPGGVNAALADASVRFFGEDVPTTTWRALGTAAGGEVTDGQP